MTNRTPHSIGFTRRFAAAFSCAAALATSASPPMPAAAEPAPAAPTLARCAFLAGSWSGEHDGGIIEEHWTAPASASMIGMARLVVGGDTLFHEYLRIVDSGAGAVEYLAQPNGDCPHEIFRLTSATPTRLVFENPAHDNPSIIRYTLEDAGATLVAVTEGVKDGERIVHETRMRRSTLIPEVAGE